MSLVGPISRYLGALPVLGAAAIWCSPNKVFEQGRSQMYHFDREDDHQIKCFVALEDMAADSGPFTLIPATESRRIYKLLRREGAIPGLNGKVEDATIYRHIDRESAIQLVGPSGTVAFVDTSACYHFGSRPGRTRRLVLVLQYFSPNSAEMPLFGRYYRDVPLEGRADLGPDVWKHLVGISHLNFGEWYRYKGYWATARPAGGRHA